ncbi:MAG TPA: isoprenylcysteine carboxylmethyltransferase family protein [Pyrinomonadaceae bacterium]|nr:isoprenylcysteine carboxylmethyltransferase family protein [Pyrinomonadaceae bacterium]
MPTEKQHVAKPFQLLLRVPVPWVYVGVYLIGVAFEYLFPLDLVPPAAVQSVNVAGGICFLIGAIVAGWSLYNFYKARTTTIPGEVSKKLLTNGFYKYTRNPMYVGLALAYIGETGLLVQIWPLFLLPFVIAYVNWIVIPLEEARLAADFGDTYEQYRSKVRRWL